MNKRIMMVVVAATLVSTAGGCTPFRNFFFGRGAKCGLCTRIRAPFKRDVPVTAPPATGCNQPACSQPVYNQPQYVPASPGCGCNSSPCQSPCSSGYGYDPYGEVIGNGVGGNWVPAPTDSQGYRANYQGYPDSGYRYDNDGARIIQEDPLPPGVVNAN